MNQTYISTCLWLNGQIEEAMEFYKSVFKNTQIGNIVRYGKAAAQASGQKVGDLLTVEMKIENQDILLLNGGPEFKFTPALSYFIWCESEQEASQIWKALSTKNTQVRMELGE